MKLREILPCILLLFGYSVNRIESSNQAEGSNGLFPCLNLFNAHYNYLKTPGESVTITCPKNCSAEGNTQWYHSYVKVKTDMSLLVWNGSSHEAAVMETPSHGSVGFFCCACEEEDDPAENGCCWGVAYQPIVNLTITASEGFTTDKETVVPVGTNLSLRCEVRGFPFVSLNLTPPAQFNRSLAQCREVEKSWYSTVLTCCWTGAELDSGAFECTGTILMDSLDNKKVKYNESASHQLSIYRIPKLVRLYQASKLEVGSRLDIACEIDCSPVAGCSVTWYFEGVAVDTDNDKYNISSDGLLHLLSLPQPGREDLGQYACVLSSRFSTSEDSRTLTVTLPDGAEPTRLKDLPGPVEDRGDGNHGGTAISSRVLVAIVIIFGGIVTIFAGVIYMICSRGRQKDVALPSREPCGETDSTDRDGLIQNMADDDVVTDDVATSSRRRQTLRGKRTRHRPSAKK